MFVRKVVLTKQKNKGVYLDVFDRRPERGKKSQPLARFGPLSQLSGKADPLVKNLREFCQDNFVTGSEISIERTWSWGPVLVARRLWEELRINDAISAACGRKVVEAAFALTANRLIDPSWKHSMNDWLERASIPGVLSPGTNTSPSGGGAGRSRASIDSLWDHTLRRLAGKRRVIEAALLESINRIRGRCKEAVLYELDSRFVERRTPGKPFMGWPPQPAERTTNLRLGIIVCDGWPVTIRFFGSGEPTAMQIKRFIEESQKRFGFRNVLFVATSGTDEEKLHQLEALGFHHLVGVRRRRDPRAVDVIQRAGRQWEKIDSDMGVQEVLLPAESDASLQAVPSDELAGDRYFLVHSKREQREEAALRRSVVNRALKALQELKQAVDNGRLKRPTTIMERAERILADRKAYRYISWKMTPEGSLEFWEAEAKSTVRRAYEGISLIKTSDAQISPASGVALYQGLRRLETAFQEIRDTAAFRSARLPLPDIEEQPTEGGMGNLFAGHLFVSELAFLLQSRLEKSLLEKKIAMPLGDAMEALRTISLIELRLGKEKHLAVSPGNRTAARILRALGIQDLEPTEDTEAKPRRK